MGAAGGGTTSRAADLGTDCSSAGGGGTTGGVWVRPDAPATSVRDSGSLIEIKLLNPRPNLDFGFCSGFDDIGVPSGTESWPNPSLSMFHVEQLRPRWTLTPPQTKSNIIGCVVLAKGRPVHRRGTALVIENAYSSLRSRRGRLGMTRKICLIPSGAYAR